jgi:hypothetical protein
MIDFDNADESERIISLTRAEERNIDRLWSDAKIEIEELFLILIVDRDAIERSRTIIDKCSFAVDAINWYEFSE